jgi:uncharacterized SAM-binding protein YcdF (DUF218 family)
MPEDFKPTPLKKRIFLILKGFFYTLGILFFLLFLLSFTDIPFYAYEKLSMPGTYLEKDPDVIVVLGGSGMPSPDGLMRTYYAAEAANKYKQADVIIALPYNETDSLYQLNLMAKELILRGIDSARISYEPAGFNTRSQALNIATRYEKRKRTLALLMITSPEHMYRSVNTFKKAGFTTIAGMATFEKPVDEEKVKDKENAPDARVKSLALRYNMWSYLHYELLVIREYCAIAYYRIKGWC